MHGCLYIHKCAFRLLLCLLFIARNQFLSLGTRYNVSIQCIFGRKFEYLQIQKHQISVKLFIFLQPNARYKILLSDEDEEWNWNKLIKICVKRISWNFVYSHSNGAQKAPRQNADRKFRDFIDRELNFISPSTHKHLSHILFLDFYLETFSLRNKGREKERSTGVSVFPLLYI